MSENLFGFGCSLRLPDLVLQPWLKSIHYFSECFVEMTEMRNKKLFLRKMKTNDIKVNIID